MPEIPAPAHPAGFTCEYSTIAQVGAICHVHPDTVRRWIRDGRLRSCRPARGKRLISRADLHAFLTGTP